VMIMAAAELSVSNCDRGRPQFIDKENVDLFLRHFRKDTTRGYSNTVKNL
jgi:hypothetical protein